MGSEQILITLLSETLVSVLEHTHAHGVDGLKSGRASLEEDGISDVHVSQFRSVAGNNPRVPILISFVLLKSPCALYIKDPGVSMAEWITTSG